MDATTSRPADASRNSAVTELRARVRDGWDSLARAERVVAGVLAESSSEKLLWATASDFGAETGTSNATVIRTLQRLGYSGLAELKKQVAAPSDALTPEERIRHRTALPGESIDQIIDIVWDETTSRLEEARRRAAADDLRDAVEILFAARTVHAYGVGSSSLAAAHLALRLSRSGHSARHIDADGFRLADELLGLHSEDVVVVFAPGRASSEVMAVLARAREVGAQTILVTDELGGELGGQVGVVLDAPHTPTGLTSEVLTSMLIGDVLVQGVTRLAPELAVETSHTLGVIRGRLGYSQT